MKEDLPYDPDEDWEHDQVGPAAIIWGLAMILVLSVVIVLTWLFYPVTALRKWWLGRR